MAQLEVQDLDTRGKVAKLLDIALEETFLSECIKVFQGLLLNLLRVMALFHEKYTCLVRFCQVFTVIIIKFVEIAVDSIDMLFMIDEVINFPFILV